MHLAAFVDDVAAADHELTVGAEASPARLQAELAEAVPEAPVTIHPEAGDQPGRLVRLEPGTVALGLAPADDLEDAFVLGTDLAVADSVSINGQTPETLGGVDETTMAMPTVQAGTLDALTHAIAALANGTDGGAFHAGVGSLERVGPDGEARGALQAAGAADTAVHVYGAPAEDVPGIGPVAVHGVPTGEVPGARFAIHDGGGDDRRKAAMVAVPDGDTYRGFLTLRSAIVDDLTGYVERTYGRESSVGTQARGT